MTRICPIILCLRHFLLIKCVGREHLFLLRSYHWKRVFLKTQNLLVFIFGSVSINISIHRLCDISLWKFWRLQASTRKHLNFPVSDLLFQEIAFDIVFVKINSCYIFNFLFWLDFGEIAFFNSWKVIYKWSIKNALFRWRWCFLASSQLSNGFVAVCGEELAAKIIFHDGRLVYDWWLTGFGSVALQTARHSHFILVAKLVIGSHCFFGAVWKLSSITYIVRINHRQTAKQWVCVKTNLLFRHYLLLV